VLSVKLSPTKPSVLNTGWLAVVDPDPPGTQQFLCTWQIVTTGSNVLDSECRNKCLVLPQIPHHQYLDPLLLTVVNGCCSFLVNACHLMSLDFISAVVPRRINRVLCNRVKVLGSFYFWTQNLGDTTWKRSWVIFVTVVLDTENI